MNKHLFDNEVQAFILQHLYDNLTSLILKGSPFQDVSIQEIAQQIQGLRVASDKFSVFAKPCFAFPTKTQLEQTSSEDTARYKMNLIDNVSSIADLTGGFGVDSFYLSQKSDLLHYCELDDTLCSIASHNFTILHASIKVHNTDGISLINNQKVDVIFVDPSRRHLQKGKISSIEDSSPNIKEHWELLLQSCDTIMVKLSPMVDITYLQQNLSHIKQIHVLSVANDVKELLVLASIHHNEKMQLVASDIKKNKSIASYAQSNHTTPIAIHNTLEDARYIYEPYHVLLKSNMHDEYASHYALQKVAYHSQFYTSNEQLELPLMKTYAIDHFQVFHLKHIKSKIKSHSHINVICRNFPWKPSEVIKKLGKKEGGNLFLICTKSTDKLVCFICSRLP